MAFDVSCTMLTYSSLYIGTPDTITKAVRVRIAGTGFKNANQYKYQRTTVLEYNTVAVFHL